MRVMTFLSALVLATGSAQATTWVVDQAGTGDAVTIQTAVDLAASGDEILIRQGTYAEEVYLDKVLTLKGESGASSTIVDAEDTREYCVRAAPLSGEIVLEGLTLTGVNGGYGFCTGISALAVPLTASLIDCEIRDNTAKYYTVQADKLTLQGTTFARNRARGAPCFGSDPSHSVGCASSTTVTADHCVFEDNSATDTAVISAIEGTFRNCVFKGNSASLNGGIFVDSWLGGVYTVDHCVFVDNDTRLFGAPIYGSSYPVTAEVTRNTFARNGPMFLWDQEITSGSVFHANVFADSDVGLTISDPGVSVTCNDAWGNTVNWQGFNSGPGANFSLDPLFCAPQRDDFTVAANSPLLPSGSPCAESIGALGQGCGAVSIHPESWARVKARYR